MGGEEVAQDDRTVPLHDHIGIPPDRAQPLTELFGVVHRGRQADEADLGRREHQHFFPDAAAVGILNEVHFVEDDGVQTAQEVRTGEQHVAEHLGGHDHHRGLWFDSRVAGQEADVLRAVGRHQVAVLLVGQRFERRGVEGLAAGLERPVHRVGRHQCLARPGGGRDEHGVSGLERLEGLELEVIGREGKLRFEIPSLARLGDGPREDGQRPSSFPIPMAAK